MPVGPASSSTRSSLSFRPLGLFGQHACRRAPSIGTQRRLRRNLYAGAEIVEVSLGSLCSTNMLVLIVILPNTPSRGSRPRTAVPLSPASRSRGQRDSRTRMKEHTRQAGLLIHHRLLEGIFRAFVEVADVLVAEP